MTLPSAQTSSQFIKNHIIKIQFTFVFSVSSAIMTVKACSAVVARDSFNNVCITLTSELDKLHYRFCIYLFIRRKSLEKTIYIIHKHFETTSVKKEQKLIKTNFKKSLV